VVVRCNKTDGCFVLVEVSWGMLGLGEGDVGYGKTKQK
jgi:hypothetical protein